MAVFNLSEYFFFFVALDAELKRLYKEDSETLKEFCDALYSKFPKRKFTIKGRNRVQGELLKKLLMIWVVITIERK